MKAFSPKSTPETQRSPLPVNKASHRQAQQQIHPATIIQRAKLDPRSLTPHDVLQLQRTIGNQAVGRLLKQGSLSSETTASATSGLVDNRPEAIAQRKFQAMMNQSPQVQRQAELQDMMNNSPRVQAQAALQAMIDNSPREVAQQKQLESMFGPTVQRQEGLEEEELQMKAEPGTLQRQSPEDEELLQGKMESVQREEGLEEEELLQGKFDPVQRQGLEDEELLQGKFAIGETTRQFKGDTEQLANRTGMPDDLKSGIENLSGIAMDDVNVHYNSSKPAQLNALAYTQGTDIHVGSGQEKHLPHEGWHVVQQKQGRVKPTMQAKGVAINDDEGLEREADVMGGKAMQMRRSEKSAFEFPIHPVQPEQTRAGSPIQDAGSGPLDTLSAQLNDSPATQRLSFLQRLVAPRRTQTPLQRKVFFRDLPEDDGTYFLIVGQTEVLRSMIDENLDEAQQDAVGWVATSDTKNIRFKSKDSYLDSLIRYFKTNFPSLKAVVDKVKSRVRNNAAKFTYLYSGQETARIYYEARGMGIADNVIADLMYTGSRNRKPKTAPDLIQEMSNWQNIVIPRGRPYKFADDDTFPRFCIRLHMILASYNLPHDDVRIQGSSLRSPLAGDVDLAIMLSRAAFKQLIATMYGERFKYSDTHPTVALRGQPVVIGAMSYNEFEQMAREIDARDQTTYKSTGKARSPCYVILQGLLSGKDKRLDELTAATDAFAKEFKAQNIESISIVVKGGEFDMEPSMKI